MAENKSPQVKSDKGQKRKREPANDGGAKSKRHRRQRREDNGTSHDKDAQKALDAAETDKAVSVPEQTPDCPVKMTPQSKGGETGWQISKPLGGRMLDIDPILTPDEQCVKLDRLDLMVLLKLSRNLILIYNNSIQVYSVVNSLLIRRIPIYTLDASRPQDSTPATIAAARLSTRNTDFVWVACSDGQVFHVDWTNSAETQQPMFRTSSGTVKTMVAVPSADADTEESLIIVESGEPSHMELVSYEAKVGSNPEPRSILTLRKPGIGLQLLEASQNGQILVGAFDDRLFLGVRPSKSEDEADRGHYEFFSFDAPDLITTLDFRTNMRKCNRKSRAKFSLVVDIVAGGARGAIYAYMDALSRVKTIEKDQPGKGGLQVHKFHWHRKAVHSIKWSRDGNYFISGGSENALVIWQVETTKKNFLPHLAGCVENIVVSASGSSYVLHLDDNSAMILSTAELRPTAFVSGIQSATVNITTPKDSLVKRVWSVAGQVRRPVPAAIKPSESSKLYVCVGNGRQTTLSGDFSAPLLQTFDLETFTSVSKQALARTQPTDVNITNKGYVIDEPLVTHFAFSDDGKWMASVDEWKPPTRDVEVVSRDLGEQLLQERHEIYLKFWHVSRGDGAMALSSRVNTPHSTGQPEPLLDLAAQPKTSCFATIGADKLVRLWRPKRRRQNGIAKKDVSDQAEVSWGCSQAIAVGGYLNREPSSDLSITKASPKAQGSIAFSQDGSTLFAAFGAADFGAVYVIDTASGDVVRILDGLWKGQLQAVRAVSSFVIVLSDELRVYDVVSDELLYGIAVPQIPGVHELLHLAVDSASGHFAVAFPVGSSSSVSIFDPEDPEPLLVQSIPHRIVSLVSASAASGFIALDDAAQIWVIAEGSNPAALAAARPLQDLGLDGTESTAEKETTLAAQEGSDVHSDDDSSEAPAGDGPDASVDEDICHPTVIPQEYLAQTLDTIAFAGLSVEDMFYKVADLLTTKLPQSTGG